MSDWDEVIFEEVSAVSGKIRACLEESGNYTALGIAASISAAGEMIYQAVRLDGKDSQPSQQDIAAVRDMLRILDECPSALTLLLAQLSKMLAKSHFETLPKGQS